MNDPQHHHHQHTHDDQTYTADYQPWVKRQRPSGDSCLEHSPRRPIPEGERKALGAS